MDALFTPVAIGAIECGNRIVMSPMTRTRAGAGDCPTALMANYYRQRAGAGMIVTEGTQPTPEGKGYWRTPGIHSQAQIDGWANVADAVHSEGSRIVMQLMHCGRVVVPANRRYDARIVAPSALACPAKVPGPDGVPVPTAMPEALSTDELPALAEAFAAAARNARAAGLDGAELHCASGYLINQFLNPASNQRTDAYGGSAENRVRFPLMVIDAVAQAIGPGRVGLRISPGNDYNGMDTGAPWDTFGPLLDGAQARGIGYVHVADMGAACPATLQHIRRHYTGSLIANNNLDPARAATLVARGEADAVSFGRAFIANPDLPARIRAGAPLAEPDYASIYVGEERGYTDYPPMDTVA